MIVNFGDVFDNHAVLRSEILGIYRKHIDYTCGELHIPYFHLVGNHEFFKPNDTKYHALQAMKGIHSEFHVVDERVDIDFMWDNVKQKEVPISLTLLPYIYDAKNFPLETNEICICHQDFKGASYGFKKSEAILDPTQVKAQLIISGHIHTRQSFDNVIYPGSAFSQSVQDLNQVKGILLFDIDTYQQKFIECPLPMWRKLEFTIDEKCSIDSMVYSLQSTVDHKHHWIIEVTGPKSEIVGYLSSDKYKKLCKNKDIKFKTNFTDKQKKMINIRSNSLEGILSEYVDKVYPGSLTKKIVKNKLFEVVKRACNEK
jgi:DNA repair exonuclease SbcCD nuclease subunit